MSTYAEACDRVPPDAVWSSSFGYPGEGGYAEFWRTPDGQRWTITNGPHDAIAPFEWRCDRLDVPVIVGWAAVISTDAGDRCYGWGATHAAARAAAAEQWAGALRSTQAHMMRRLEMRSTTAEQASEALEMLGTAWP